MKVQEVRERFVHFFEARAHKPMPSSSLVPRKDPTVLLTTAGMLQFKPVFMGQAPREVPRAVTIQKCFRTTDLDNVGRTARHHTFFEMLGNFSFGDYFKEEVIPWAWEFLTKDLGLDPDKLHISVFREDDEAERIWHEKVGVPRERIVRLGEDDNFWAAGPTGPCGPCSEIYVDHGAARGCGKADCAVGCDCERFEEVWNLVFMEFNRDEAGKLTPLPAKNIDTGMGVERIASVLQHVPNNFETDELRQVLATVEAHVPVKYGAGADSDVSLKVVTDHVRGATFLVGDGVVPSNEGRGYVLRRLIRRAYRHGRLLGVKEAFLEPIAAKVIDLYGRNYPELSGQRDFILETLREEERRFRATIDRGEQLLATALATVGPDKVLSGDVAFELYDTYGFPLELTQELAGEQGIRVDETGFLGHMEAQRDRARSAREKEGVAFTGATVTTKDATAFVGYERLDERSTVVETLRDPQGRVGVVLRHTPFYPEGGGQVGDVGTLAGKPVVDTQKQGEAIVHILAPGVEAPAVGADVEVQVDVAARRATMRHHTATHLLQAALKRVLGPQINQAGSLVAPGELRFDFTFPRGMTADEIAQVEDLVNDRILADEPVVAREMGYAEATKAGAMALFGEKYGDKVRVITVEGFSMELCGGTHVPATGVIGSLKVLREEGVAAGVRRITAVCGLEAVRRNRAQQAVLTTLTDALKASPDEVPERLSKLQEGLKEAEKELKSVKAQLARFEAEKLLASPDLAITVRGKRVVAKKVQNVASDSLRTFAEFLRDKEGGGIVITETKGEIAASGAILDGLGDAGKLIQKFMQSVGGRGGGKPSFGQGGGGNPAKLPEAWQMLVQDLEKLKAD